MLQSEHRGLILLITGLSSDQSSIAISKNSMWSLLPFQGGDLFASKLTACSSLSMKIEAQEAGFSVVFETGLPLLHKCSHAFSPVILQEREVSRGSACTCITWHLWGSQGCSCCSLPVCCACSWGREGNSAAGPPAAWEEQNSLPIGLGLERRFIPQATVTQELPM